MKIDPILTKPHLRALLFRSYLMYLEEYHPEVDVEQLCEEVGLPMEYVLNDDNWVSVVFESRFMEAIKQRVSDPNLIYKVGEYGVRAKVVGKTLHFLCFNLFKLSTAYEKLPFFTSVLNKIVKMSVKKIGYNKYEYDFKPNHKNLTTQESRILLSRMEDFISNTKGYYTAIPTQKKLERAIVEVQLLDPQKMHYKFTVALPFDASGVISKINIVSFLVFSVVFGLLIYPYNFPQTWTWLSSIALSAAVVSLLKNFGRKNQASNALQVSESLHKLSTQYDELDSAKRLVQRKLDESDALTEVIMTIASAASKEKTLSSTCSSLCAHLRYDRAVVLMADSEKGRLIFSAGHGIEKESLPIFEGLSLPLEIENKDPRKITNVFNNGVPILISDVETHLKNLSDEMSIALLKKSKSTSFAAVPIQTNDKKHGVLIVDCYESMSQLTQDDIQLLNSVASQLAIAIEKADSLNSLKLALDKTERLTNSYSRFVPFSILKQLNYDNVFDVAIGDGLEKPATILFSDIRNFSSLCEDMQPKEVLNFLNSYFGKLSPIIDKNNGVIDKFIGDCVMAIFTNEVDALNAGIEIQRSLIHYNIDRRFGGRVPIFAGIGICAGDIILGPLGFSGRLDITVLSDTVNIASRLDSMCKDLKAKILVSGVSKESLQSLPEEVCVIEHGSHQVKGKQYDVDVVEILDPDLIDQFENYEQTEELIRFKQIYISHVIEKMQKFQKTKKAS